MFSLSISYANIENDDEDLNFNLMLSKYQKRRAYYFIKYEAFKQYGTICNKINNNL